MSAPICRCVWDCRHEWCGCPVHQPKPVAVTISKAEQLHIDELHRRSYRRHVAALHVS